MDDLQTWLETALHALPPNAVDIAYLFADLGITYKGRGPRTCNCPISEFLKTELGRHVSSDSEYVSVFDCPPADDYLATIPRVSFSAGTPPHVADFIVRFDSGDFPWLDES
jgi:hypothetical protein